MGLLKSDPPVKAPGPVYGRDHVWNIGTTRRAVRSMSVRVINVSKIVISDDRTRIFGKNAYPVRVDG